MEAKGRAFLKEKSKGGRLGNGEEEEPQKTKENTGKPAGERIPQTMSQDGSLQELNHKFTQQRFRFYN